METPSNPPACLSDDRLHVVVPLVMSVCEVSSQADEAVVASLSFQFGKLCSGLTGEIPDRFHTELKARLRTLESNISETEAEEVHVSCRRRRGGRECSHFAHILSSNL